MTVSNWQYWRQFLHEKVFQATIYPMSYFVREFFFPLFWDYPPFAINLSFASAGIVFAPPVDLSSVVFPILNDFDSSNDNRFKHKLQKRIATSLKPHFFSWDV